MADLGPVPGVVQLLGAAIGANVVGMALRKLSFNPALMTIIGVVGALIGRHVLGFLLPALPNSGPSGSIELPVVLTAFASGAAVGIVAAAIAITVKQLSPGRQKA